MNVTLLPTKSLILRASAAARHATMACRWASKIALNLLWRKKVRVPVLAKVFRCSKNTIYYNCLTGDAPSYPASGSNKGACQS